MKLSEAILLGRHLVTECVANPQPGAEADGAGCALTMAVLAAGGKADILGCVWTEAETIWPWLDTTKTLKITDRFDQKVMRGLMTLEQLVDYVRSIEPAEQEPEDDEISDVRPEYKGRIGG